MSEEQTYQSPEYKASANEEGFEEVPENNGSVNDDETLPRASCMSPRTVIPTCNPNLNDGIANVIV